MISETENSAGTLASLAGRSRCKSPLTLSRQVRPQRQSPASTSPRKPAAGADPKKRRRATPASDFRFTGKGFLDEGSGVAPAYLREVSLQPMLTQAEETSIGERLRTGNDAARERLVLSHLRLVVRLAFDYAGFGLPVADLISEGNLGLMRATVSFDPAFGARFSTYATLWIKKHIRGALTRQSRLVRLPAGVVHGAARVKAAEDGLRKKLGRQPTDAELSENTEFLHGQIGHFRNAIEQSCVSLDGASAPDGDGPTLAETLVDDQAEPADETLARRSDRDYLEELLGQLAPRDARVLRLRFGLDEGGERSLEEVGRCVGLGRQRVHQIESSCLRWLRNRARLAELDVGNDARKSVVM